MDGAWYDSTPVTWSIQVAAFIVFAYVMRSLTAAVVLRGKRPWWHGRVLFYCFCSVFWVMQAGALALNDSKFHARTVEIGDGFVAVAMLILAVDAWWSNRPRKRRLQKALSRIRQRAGRLVVVPARAS